MKRRALIVSTAVLIAGAARPAAAEPAQADAVMAQSLFEQGRALLTEGKVADACVKFEESQRLDPGGGTLLNLALCHEREGRIATAHAELEQALGQAIKDNRKDREEIARAHIASLAPRLPKLVVDVVSPVEGEEVLLDGRPLPRAAWGSAIAADPGSHALEARAAGHKPVTVHTRSAERSTSRVKVPALVADPNAPPPSPPPVVGPPAQATWPLVHVEADKPEAILEEQRKVGPGAVVVTQSVVMVDDGTRWFVACRTPCDRKLDPTYAYRVNGSGITPSPPFTLTSGADRVRLDVKAGSSGKLALGATMSTLGVLGVATGATLLLLGVLLTDTAQDDRDRNETLRTSGVITLGIGGALMIGGIVLAAGAQTEVKRDGEPVSR